VDDHYRLENRAGAWALAVSDRIRAGAAEVVDDDGVAAALISLSIYDGASIERLRHIVGLSHAGAVRLVDRLESEGFVLRGRAADSRAVALHLTRAGRDAAKRVLAARERALQDALAPLTVRERRSLKALLDKLLLALPSDRRELESICRLCDYRTCDGNLRGVCPVDVAVIATEG
jgi:DNA-binding MarR family transcriptional regulator